MEFLFLFAGLIIGFIMAWLYLKAKQPMSNGDGSLLQENILKLEKELSVATERAKLISEEKNRIISDYQLEKEKLTLASNEEREKLLQANQRLAKAEEAFRNMNEKLNSQKQEMEEMQKRFTTEFENIANKLLDEKSQKFTEQNKTNMDVILNPLKEKIKTFEEKVDKAYKEEAAERNSLKGEIKNLIELNKQISEEANGLARALKGENKTQGNWGELMLEKTLEYSGLIKDIEYKLQVSTSNAEGNRIQPDAIVFLPDNKHIIIDSKVSLNAYTNLSNANTDVDRERYLKEHLLSVRTHVKGLSEKAYQTSPDLNTPDFVLLFMPVESSFSLAVQADNELFNYAWDRKIVIVSPTTLLATLRTIASVWKSERQTKNALIIAEESGKLYDKFVGFLEDMQQLGKELAQSQNAYNDAMNKLKTGTGNLVNRAEQIKKLGAKTSKQIDKNMIHDTDEQNNLLQ